MNSQERILWTSVGAGVVVLIAAVGVLIFGPVATPGPDVARTVLGERATPDGMAASARIRLEDDDPIGAYQDATWTLSEDPTHVEARRTRIDAALALEDLGPARDDLLYLRTKAPASFTPDDRRRLADLFARTGLPGEAVKEMDTLLDAAPDDATLLRRRGAYRLAAGDFAGAQTDLARSRELTGWRPDTARQLGRAAWGLGAYDAALAEFTRAIDVRRGAPHNHFGRGLTHLFMGDHERAVEDLRTEMRMRLYGQGSVRAMLWVALNAAGDADGADGVVQRALDDADLELDQSEQMMLKHLVGAVSGPALLRAARQPRTGELTIDRLVEAYFYLGAKHEVAGEVDEAVTNYLAAIGTEARTHEAYFAALAALRRLDAAPTGAAGPEAAPGD